MRESYILKSQIHDTDTPTYMEALSGEHADKYYKAVNDEIQSLMIRYTYEIVSRKSVSDHNMLPVTLSSKYKRKPDGGVRKFNARCCVREGVQKILSFEPLNSYSTVV